MRRIIGFLGCLILALQVSLAMADAEVSEVKKLEGFTYEVLQLNDGKLHSYAAAILAMELSKQSPDFSAAFREAIRDQQANVFAIHDASMGTTHLLYLYCLSQQVWLIETDTAEGSPDLPETPPIAYQQYGQTKGNTIDCFAEVDCLTIVDPQATWTQYALMSGQTAEDPAAAEDPAPSAAPDPVEDSGEADEYADHLINKKFMIGHGKQDLRVRSGPGTNHPQIATLPKNQKFEIVATYYSDDGSGEKWYKLAKTWDQQDGFVIAGTVRVE